MSYGEIAYWVMAVVVGTATTGILFYKLSQTCRDTEDLSFAMFMSVMLGMGTGSLWPLLTPPLAICWAIVEFRNWKKAQAAK